MDLKKISLNENMIPSIPTKVDGSNHRSVSNGQIGGSFNETLQEISKSESVNQALTQKSGLNAKNLPSIKFSNHAIERMQSRGISLGKEDLARLNEAVTRAATKGSKDSLVLMNESAFIVSVKNNTVVTVMDKNSLKENVFTNIDSTIVM